MATGYRKIRIFVASPADVAAERDAVANVVNELNTIIAALVPEASTILEVVRWETHAFPAFGRPQAVINDQLHEYDIFLGIMWKRFGTPTGAAGSGTEEELRIALRHWEEHHRPHIMFYFSAAPSPPPATASEVEQLARVVAFRTELAQRGLVWQYSDGLRFADVIRPHLAAAVGQMIRAPQSMMLPGERVQIRISGIAPEDAYYAVRERLIGRFATPHSLTATGDGWSGGVVEFEAPPLDTAETRVSFFRFQWEAQL